VTWQPNAVEMQLNIGKTINSQTENISCSKKGNNMENKSHQTTSNQIKLKKFSTKPKIQFTLNKMCVALAFGMTMQIVGLS
jgi:hypothetical protein